MPAVGWKRGPTFRKPPPELTRAFERAVGKVPDGQVQIVFGYPCLFVGGHMTVGPFGKDLFLRLSDSDSARLKEVGGKPFSLMAGRPMAGYTIAPPAVWSSAAPGSNRRCAKPVPSPRKPRSSLRKNPPSRTRSAA